MVDVIWEAISPVLSGLTLVISLGMMVAFIALFPWIRVARWILVGLGCAMSLLAVYLFFVAVEIGHQPVAPGDHNGAAFGAAMGALMGAVFLGSGLLLVVIGSLLPLMQSWLGPPVRHALQTKQVAEIATNSTSTVEGLLRSLANALGHPGENQVVERQQDVPVDESPEAVGIVVAGEMHDAGR